MPDWTPIRDRDGNKYFIDKNGKIWTSGTPEFEYKAVSIEGLDYYLNQSIELIKSNYKTSGLTLLKSIMAMPVKNNRIFKAQCRASKEINYLIKKEGIRYSKLNDSASLLLFRDNKHTILINDKMLYSIIIPKVFKIIKKRFKKKLHYIYCGILVGFILKKNGVVEKHGYRGHDLLLAIDSEKFSSPIRSVTKIEKNWRRNLGSDTFNRKVFDESDNRIVYAYEDRLSPYYSGFEGFYYKGNHGYCLRILCSREVFLKYRERIIQILKSFKI